MSNNVGTPLFYVGLGLFAFFLAYQADIWSETLIIDKAAETIFDAGKNTIHALTAYSGGSATKRHKKYRISKSKRLKRE